MPRNATPATVAGTPAHELPDTLSPAQAKALGALLTGSTVAQAATAAGVDRTTVHRWLKGDPAFMAAYNEARLEAVEMARAGLHSLAGLAVDAYREALDPRMSPRLLRLKAAAQVLKMLGADTPAPVGATDPEAAATELKLAQGARDFERVLADLSTG